MFCRRFSLLALLCALGLGCPADDDPAGADEGASDDSSSDGGTPATVEYAVGSLVFGTDETSLYVALVDELAGQTIDLDQSREFAGSGDLWVHDGAVFVAEAQTLTITKFAVEGDALVERGKIGFSNYGLTDFGFWVNAFAASDKAYFLNGTSEAIVWDPAAMTIGGTVAMPELPVDEGFMPFASYIDRASVLHDGRLYIPVYTTDESFFLYTPDTRVLVLDVATDEFVDEFVVPCPGIDFASKRSEGEYVLSNWVYAAGGAALLEQPTTCTATLVPGAEPTVEVDVDFAALTDGRQGAAMQYTGAGKAVFSVLHPEHVTDGTTDPSEITFGANWKFWSYDAASGSATMLDTIDWNSGAAYWSTVDGRAHMLVPLDGYASTEILDFTDPAAPAKVLGTDGWTLRLFDL